MKHVWYGLLAAIMMMLGVERLSAQSAFAVVKSNGTTIIAGSLKSAIDTAANGDIIYLPTGSIDVTGVKVNKGVHLIGAGYYPDSSGAAAQSMLAGSLIIVSGADGGSVQGVFVNGSITFGTNQNDCEVHNYVIRRNYIASALYLSYAWNTATNGSNFTITENVINYGFCGGLANNVMFSNNILVQLTQLFRPLTTIKNATIANNVIIPLDSYVSNDVSFSTFKNNIIVLGTLGYVNNYQGNIYLNNLHCSTTGLNSYGVVQSNGNVYIEREKIFVKQNGGSYLYSDNYHLLATALSAISGTDGSQVGVYGGQYAWKDGGLPPNPAILQAKVASKTNAKGKLDIEFKVQAQTK